MTASLHKTDYFDWSWEQAALLKAGRLSEVDTDLPAEEIEDMGNEGRAACFSFITRILEHLLKLRYSVLERNRRHWQNEIIDCRVELEQRLTKSIESQVDLAPLYRHAVRKAKGRMTEKGFADRLPAVYPWTLDQVRDEDYWPERET
ncbi:MAG: DUF29 domain-containing protein, partial [Rhodospirillaceae bacterium]